MAHIKPEAEHMRVLVVTIGGQDCIVPYDVPTGDEVPLEVEFDDDGWMLPEWVEKVGPALAKYCDAIGEVTAIQEQEGWFSRLNAPGYMDRTEWDGPFDSEVEAIAHQCELHEIDEDGDDGFYHGTATECVDGEAHKPDLAGAKFTAIRDGIARFETVCHKCQRPANIEVDLSDMNVYW